MVSVNSCELAAYNSRKANDGKKVLTALNAGNGFVFAALYDGEREVRKPTCLTLAEFETLKTEVGDCHIAADSETAQTLNVRETQGDGIIELSKSKYLRGETTPYQKVDASYVRLSQTEKTAT